MYSTETTPRRVVKVLIADFGDSSPADHALRKVRRARAAPDLIRRFSLPEEGEPIASVESIELIMKTGGLSQASLDALCVEEGSEEVVASVLEKAPRCSTDEDLGSTASTGLSQQELDALSSEEGESSPDEINAPEDMLYIAKRLRTFAGAVEVEAFAAKCSSEATLLRIRRHRAFSEDQVSSSMAGRQDTDGFNQAELDAECQGGSGSESGSSDEAALLRIRRHRAFSGAAVAERFAADVKEKCMEKPNSRFDRAQLELDRLCIDEDACGQDAEIALSVASSPSLRPCRSGLWLGADGDIQVATPQRRLRISLSGAGSKPSSPMPKQFEASSPKAWSPGMKLEGSPGRGGA